jgi:hypothetical protein
MAVDLANGGRDSGASGRGGNRWGEEPILGRQGGGNLPR